MPVEIIAEAAQGYEGNPTLARMLARAAGRAAADAVKFQLVIADELATPDYQYYALFRQLEMSLDDWRQVVEEARTAGVRVYFDVFGPASLDHARTLGADGVKIHSTDFFNVPLVWAALAAMPRVFISLGGIAPEEVEQLLAGCGARPGSQVCLMYGFQAEPTPVDANHLRRLGALRARFPGYRLGFMDHADGGTDDAGVLALLALPYGVDCIEKHLTLDRALRLEDFVSAVSPETFRLFVERVRRLEPALGLDSLELTEAERAYRRKAVKVVVANRPMRKGERLDAAALALKRVARPDETAFHRLADVAGRILTADVKPNQQITGELLE